VGEERVHAQEAAMTPVVATRFDSLGKHLVTSRVGRGLVLHPPAEENNMQKGIFADTSDVSAIQQFFFPNDLKAATREIKNLTPADRAELGSMVRDTVAN
jgi:hypothetical protein